MSAARGYNFDTHAIFTQKPGEAVRLSFYMGKKSRLKKERDAGHKYTRHMDVVNNVLNKYSIPRSTQFDSGSHESFIYEGLVARYLAPLDQGRTHDALMNSAGNHYLQYEEALDKAPHSVQLEDGTTKGIACKEGCNHCCYVRVTTTAPQVILMAGWLKESLTAQELMELLGRIEVYELDQKNRPMVDQIIPSRLCPVNYDGKCQSYDIRPSGCAAHHSFNVNDCIKDREEPHANHTVSANPIRYHFRALFDEAQRTALKALGLDGTELEFVPALRIALLDDDVSEKYLRGEPVFAEADKPEVRKAAAIDYASRFGKQLPMVN